jgi:hypothetical protein
VANYLFVKPDFIPNNFATSDMLPPNAAVSAHARYWPFKRLSIMSDVQVSATKLIFVNKLSR